MMMGHPVPPPPPDRVEDHLYVFTIVGRCGHHNCSKTEDLHPVRLTQPDPLTECNIDHKSLHPRQINGDEGVSWSRCPGCGVMVEPYLQPGALTGHEDGPGRGDLSWRLQRHLKGWLGWLNFNGGER